MIRFILKNGSPIKEFVYDTNRLTMVKENDILYSSNQDENSIDLNNITPNILYDNYGNIIQTDKAHITYNSRNLMETYEINSNEKYLFTYNYQGVRCKKQRTAGSQYSVYYYLDGSRIMGEDSYGISGNTIHKFRYYYDVEGICGINYITSEGNHYYNLIKDSLGNVSKIMYRGKYIGEYIYDAWGNCEVRELSASNDLDRYALYYNPFRYKGYYYDVETQLYLVSSRYYSPELCRWISPDDIEYLDPESINGLNLYCYCGNDPVNRYDVNGHFWDYVFDAVFIAIGIYDFIKEPSWSKAGWLALDIGLAILPFIPAISSARHLGKVDDVIDIASGLNKIDNVNDALGGLRYADDVLDTGQDIGTYLLKNADGDVIYVGKGSRNRMMHNFNKFNANSFLYYPAKNIDMAFANEAYFMAIYGGSQSMMKNYRLLGGYKRATKLFNKINSPGLKYLFYWL